MPNNTDNPFPGKRRFQVLPTPVQLPVRLARATLAKIEKMKKKPL